MGATGSGKSTFINLVSGSDLSVSDRLTSCTREVEIAPVFQLDDRSVRLIDTPGFDDTERSDIDVLREIAQLLENQYKKGTRLHGVIYLQRISDVRMGGSSTRSFRLFKKICGDLTLKNVVIVTTMWDKVTRKEGEQRELELSTDERFFKPALDQEAKLTRHDNTTASGCQILRGIFDNHPLALGLQCELVDENKKLRDTDVGQEFETQTKELMWKMSEDIKELRKELADMQQSYGREIKDQSGEIRELQGELSRAVVKLATLSENLGKLGSDLDPNAVTVAVMGPTGSGKSTFINVISNSKFAVSNL